MQPQRRGEVGRHLPHGAQRVGHQRAAARPGLGEQHRVGRADALPGDGRPERPAPRRKPGVISGAVVKSANGSRLA